MTSWRWRPLCNTLCKTIHNNAKTRHNSSWYMGALSSWIALFSSCVVCESFLYAHRKKSRTVRPDDPTRHVIPDTWKCSLRSLTPLIHCHWTGYEMAWHHLSVCRLLPTLFVRQSAFWNMWVVCAPHSAIWNEDLWISLIGIATR